MPYQLVRDADTVPVGYRWVSAAFWSAMFAGRGLDREGGRLPLGRFPIEPVSRVRRPI